ncbi:ROK family transcriptional regulator [Nocardioides astragali]|uniref:ROK family transcriptional regulator n=1 Tax=Nocardioides astragali TaxID=1776736 RepID=A0ABW2N025_9ACTN|nr:ROK family transcriptional regulator [Nocardioides astragali]
MTIGPGSTSALRDANRRRVLDALRLHGGGTSLSQADLARSTGLAAATVSTLVRELTEAGLVAVEPASGRRGSAVRLAGDAGVVAGVDVGRSHVAVALGDVSGRVLREERRTVGPHGHEEALTIAHELLSVLTPGGAGVRHLVLGLPAPIRDDVVGSSAVLPGWDGVVITPTATDRLGVPVTVENDANLGALGEHRVGAGQGHDCLVYLKVGSGVGGGVILDGALFRGGGGTAGEVGHLTLDDRGPLCRCGGRGCLESYASADAVRAQVEEQLPGASFADVVAAAQAGNVSARRAIADAGRNLGWGLGSVVNLLSPTLVVIGGELASAGDLVLEPARQELRRHVLGTAVDTPVEASQLGGRATLVGAVLAAADHLASTLSWEMTAGPA